MSLPPLEPGKYYHIYNRGNNREDLFRSEANYLHFLMLFERFIYPVADIYAWVLLRNHFHLFVRVKDRDEIFTYKVSKLSNPTSPSDVVRSDNNGPIISRSSEIFLQSGSTPSHPVKHPIHTLHFSHFFNAYARYYNKRYNRIGTLFQRPFKRIELTDEDYFRHLIVYIHNNPVHHGFANDHRDYPWSSYHELVTDTPSRLEREQVINWFDDLENFKALHYKKLETYMNSELFFDDV